MAPAKAVVQDLEHHLQRCTLPACCFPQAKAAFDDLEQLGYVLDLALQEDASAAAAGAPRTCELHIREEQQQGAKYTVHY